MIATGRKIAVFGYVQDLMRFVYYLAVKKKTMKGELYLKEVINSSVSVFDLQRYLQHENPEWDGSPRLRCYVYFIPSGVQLKKAIVFAYRTSLAAKTSTGTDRETSMEMETNDQESDNVESEAGADVSDIGNYFIASEISEKIKDKDKDKIKRMS